MHYFYLRQERHKAYTKAKVFIAFIINIDCEIIYHLQMAYKTQFAAIKAFPKSGSANDFLKNKY